MNQKKLTRLRNAMVESQLRDRGISDPAVLHAFKTVPRHKFVSPELQHHAYEDKPLPIEYGQTISQPYIVAMMTELLKLNAEDRVLEIGAGSGYQTAILSVLCDEVYAVERHSGLLESARTVLEEIGTANVAFRIGDGSEGWPEEAPFDAILAAAAAPVTPKPLLDQLAIGGRLVIPVGSQHHQVLKRYIRTGKGLEEEDHGGCRFVKFIGAHAWPED